MFVTAREFQVDHSRLVTNAIQTSKDLVTHSRFVFGGSLCHLEKEKQKHFPLHDTSNGYHSNELRGVPAYVMIDPRPNNVLRGTDEVRMGFAGECLIREEKVWSYSIRLTRS